MQNQVYLEEKTNILVSIYHGDQTADSINSIAEANKPIIKELRQKGGKVLLLIDTSDIKGQTAGARRAALEQLNTLDYDKLAIFGATIVIKKVVEFLIVMTLRREKVKYFETEKEARDWLLSA